MVLTAPAAGSSPLFSQSAGTWADTENTRGSACVNLTDPLNWRMAMAMACQKYECFVLNQVTTGQWHLSFSLRHPPYCKTHLPEPPSTIYLHQTFGRVPY